MSQQLDDGVTSGGLFGIAGAAFQSADQHSAAAAVTSAPVTGAKLVINDIMVSVDTNMTLTFTEETSGTVLLVAYVTAYGGLQQITPRGKLKLATANKRLMVQSSVAGNVAVTVFYYSET